MNDPFLATTLHFALIFGLAVLVLAVCGHALMPRRTKTVLASLVGIEIALFFSDFVYESSMGGTGMEIMAAPGVLIGLLVGNLLAIPIARSLRSLFNRGSTL